MMFGRPDDEDDEFTAHFKSEVNEGTDTHTRQAHTMDAHTMEGSVSGLVREGHGKRMSSWIDKGSFDSCL